MTEGNADEFSISSDVLGLNTTNDLTGYVYYINASDLAGNPVTYKNAGDDWTITVLDAIRRSC